MKVSWLDETDWFDYSVQCEDWIYVISYASRRELTDSSLIDYRWDSGLEVDVYDSVSKMGLVELELYGIQKIERLKK